MKQNITYPLILALLVLMAFSCRRNSSPAPNKWPKVNVAFDKLTDEAEQCLFDSYSFDKVGVIVEKMDSIEKSLSGKKAVLAKDEKTYWQLYIDLCIGDSKKAKLRYVTPGVLDSVSDEYIKYRMADIYESCTQVKSVETLENLLDFYDYYGKVGDWGSQGNMAMFISNNLSYPIIPELSLQYLEKADSLFALAGLENRREGIRINKFNFLCELDKKDEAEKEYRHLLGLAMKDEDRFREEMLRRNHYFFFKDRESLYEGYKISKSFVENDSAKVLPAAMRGLYEALICSDYLNTNDIAKAGEYAQLCENHLGELVDLDQVLTEYKSLSDYYDKVGNQAKANDYLRKYVELRDKNEKDLDPLMKINVSQLDTILRHELEVETERHELRVRKYVIIGISLFVILALLTFIIRWRNRQREKTLKLKLEAERHQRRVLAMSTHQEETEKLLDDVKQEMDRINKEGIAKSDETRRLEQNVKLHMAGKGEKETFEEAFANVSPEFSSRLKEIAPSLTPSNIRLCTYFYMGLTAHEIADLMHITDNGLRVARFRLRQKFGLSKDESLEDFLRNLTN